MLFNKCWCLPAKMSCILNFVIFAILSKKVFPYPTTINQTSEVLEYTEMGTGLDEIPLGNTRIKSLNLAYNHLSSLADSVFQNKSYKSLVKIELNQNKISTIHLTAFRGLKQLIDVDLSENNLTYIHPYTFKYNTKLEKLDLSGNKITFPRLKVVLTSQSLETLILSDNLIEQVYEFSFVGVTNLRILVLDNNILSAIAPKSFKLLNKLQSLSIANTGVYHLSESMFNTNNLPRVLNVEGTPLAEKFGPPALKQVTNKNNAVKILLNIDQLYIKNPV